MADTPVQPSSVGPAAREALVEHYETLLKGVTPAAKAPAFYEVFIVRDQIAAASRDGNSPSFSSARKIGELDDRLKRTLGRIPRASAETLARLRDSVQPAKENWWWNPGKPPSLWLTVGATALLTFSVTLFTDFTRRVLSTGPDGAGILTVGFQALLAVGATSTFTEGGRQWIERILVRRHVKRRRWPVWKLAGAAFLFVVTLLAWDFTPGWLAERNNDQGLRAGVDSPAALPLFQRAVALSPELAIAHFNLGAAYDKRYEYDKAMAEYEETLILNPSDVKAYTNLSRLLIIADRPLTALSAASDGLRAAGAATAQSADDLRTIATLRKNKAWAELQLQFYADAENDATVAAANQFVAPAGYCILGKIYTKEGNLEKAQQWWERFQAARLAQKDAEFESDCANLAEAASHETK